jgi:hypothetical protein
MRDDVQALVQKLSASFELEVGTIPVERLIAIHLDTFRMFRDRGLTWEQISGLLSRAGVKRAEGRPFGAAHLRGVYARQLRRQAVRRGQARSRASMDPVNRPSDEGIGPARDFSLAQRSPHEAAFGSQSGQRGDTAAAQVPPAVANGTTTGGQGEADPTRAIGILGTLQRAAAARRSSPT